MFNEFKCGCIIGTHTGRVRICEVHSLDRQGCDGNGGDMSLIANPPKGKPVRKYPADGTIIEGWNGR